MFLGTDDQSVYRNRFRMKRFGQLVVIIDEIIKQKGHCNIIDVGGRFDHWNALSDIWGGRSLHVTLVNLEAETVTDPHFTSLAGDACDLKDHADNSFDLAYSNSVIEHVGQWSNQKRMASETRRVAPRHFIQTPNYWFPLEPHFRTPFIHWLPRPWRALIVQAKACGFYPKAANVDEANAILQDAILLNAPSMAALFPESTIVKERVAGLTKSLIAVR